MRVLNKYKDSIPDTAVYIGRPSKWGNPFSIGKHGSREEVIKQYREWIMKKPLLIKEARIELKGKDLVCFCAPKCCMRTSNTTRPITVQSLDQAQC